MFDVVTVNWAEGEIARERFDTLDEARRYVTVEIVPILEAGDAVRIIEVEDAEEDDQFRSDAEADADVLRSAGWGTDEDYGYYNDFE